MTKKLLIFTLSTSMLFAYSNNDWDWDGVDDKDDKCPYSQFSDLVDKNGCKVSSTQSEHHFDVLLGVSQVKSNEYDNTTSSLQLDYYYKDFSFSLSNAQYDYESSEYDYSDDGQSDYYLSAKYKLKPTDKLSVYLKGGAIIPANSDVENNNVDYFISPSLSYQLQEDWSLFGGVNYTFIQNDDTNTTEYQNSLSSYLGVSYRPTYNSSLSLLYSRNSLMYKDEDDTDFAYLTGSYYFNENWFGVLNFGQELSGDNKEQYSSVQVGYYF